MDSGKRKWNEKASEAWECGTNGLNPYYAATGCRAIHKLGILVAFSLEFLQHHPNQPYVQSVCRGLREGFWPHATIPPDSPDTFDFSDRPQSKEALSFIRAQRDKEITTDRFSITFGPDLLPGMFSSPIGAIPKPHSTGMRLITDQSAGPHSLNSFIPKDAAAVRYDNMHDLGKLLRKVHKKYGRPPAYLFKSDCSEAFRHIPMHVLWQIRQIVTVDGQRHVDRCLVFGNRGAPNIWCAFMALVVWIAIHIKQIEDLLHYMDDAFSYEMDPVLEYYAPYDSHYPKKQVALLRLWDELGLPLIDFLAISMQIFYIETLSQNK
ncbi:hypothetical protein M422DRAFT_271140 [Sphaerobolus stellatus SS14]|uniref:Reverse transcriptase domain-containing protein n=1 Tax=Sphaerobolus stellatus (strain SS14) TaxID=990650 RepID=A0A0C9UQG7_SPHS4|nr:hypothetical protein M422DRAFT_271140 [Sphaerobolus stellatus SS14]